MRFSTYIFLILSTISAVTLAIPAPTSPMPSFVSLLDSTPAGRCRPTPCNDDKPTSHAFCQSIGCEFCLQVGSEPGNMHYECEGMPAGANGGIEMGPDIEVTGS
ncbi:hypothetical protein ABVK25_004749 [Lepraria finkii]|uniref:Uncharacterized protein n=1 Tax=Lepraria finkii TaxID=1340010 RepID=A0ABR4BAP9_9LECA